MRRPATPELNSTVRRGTVAYRARHLRRRHSMIRYLDGRQVSEAAVVARGGVLSNKLVLVAVAISVFVVVIAFAYYRRMA